MKRLVIAVDCDDVLLPATEACVRIYNATHGTKVRLEEAHQGDSLAWQAERGEVLRRFSELQRSDDFANIPPFDEAVQTCMRLAKHHDLYVVTARNPDVMPVTLAMLDRYFPGVFNQMEHVGLDGNKGDVCQRLQADVLIDDSYKHIEAARNCGVKNLLWFGEYIWQDTVTEPPEGILRCASWREVEAEIERIATR